MTHRQLFENQSPSSTMEDAHRILELLGPTPGQVLAAMVDYGLSDDEIGRYFDLPHEMISTLRRHWGIDRDP